VDKAKKLLAIFLVRERSRYFCKINNSTILISSIHHPIVIFPFHSVNHFLDSIEPYKANLVADVAYPANGNANADADADARADAMMVVWRWQWG
jgi:hypothetical protein